MNADLAVGVATEQPQPLQQILREPGPRVFVTHRVGHELGYAGADRGVLFEVGQTSDVGERVIGGSVESVMRGFDFEFQPEEQRPVAVEARAGLGRPDAAYPPLSREVT